MTYTTGSVIDDADYNTFAAGTDAVWGDGGTDSGYGQTDTVGFVTQGFTVTATQWATLLTRIASSASHSGTSISAISNPTAGSTISAYAALSTNVAAIRNNNAAASGSDSTVSTTTTSAWTASATTTKTITFAEELPEGIENEDLLSSLDASDSRKWLVQNNQRRLFPDLSTIFASGYDFSKFKAIALNIIKKIPEGEMVD